MKVIRRDIIIGDVHGCADELNLLLKQLNPTCIDRVYFLGDLIDKGPNVSGVFDIIFNLKDKTLTQSVLGNHEERLLRYIKYKDAGKLCKMMYIEDMEKSLSQLNYNHLAFIRDMPIAITINSDWWQRSTIIHGGILPTTPLREIENKTLKDIKDKKLLNCVNKAIRVRYLDPKTYKMVDINQVNDTDLFWASIYDGRFGHIYFGHSPVHGSISYKFNHATGVDNGCVFGGYLSAEIRLHKYEGQKYLGTDYRSIHVNAKRQYQKPREEFKNIL